MTGWVQRIGAIMAALALTLPIAAKAQNPGDASSAKTATQPQGGFVLKMNGELVLTNVVARDAKTGELVRGLKQSDFSIYENGKQQQIETFDFESVDMATPLNEATISGLAAGPNSNGPKAVVVARPEDLRNHRLIVMFFDLTSMQPEDLDRSVEAAQDFLRTQDAAGRPGGAGFAGRHAQGGPGLYRRQECADQRSGRLQRHRGTGLCAGRDRELEPGGGHHRLHARRERVQRPQHRPRAFRAAGGGASLWKRSRRRSRCFIFPAASQRDGIENQASLRSAINAAVRANLAIYSVDTRGLQAISPLGDASTGSLRGTGAYNGGALLNNMNANFATQEVMATLSSDTGGKAFFDSNDFAPAFAQVQRDTSAYYAIGFHSTNPARDGNYRKLTIKINRPGVKLEYRPGYYAPADFQHSGHEDRERELEEQLASDLPATDMAVYHGCDVFQAGREPLLCAGFADRARLADSVCEGRRQGQGHAGHHRRGDRRGEAAHRPCARDGEAEPRSRSLKARQKNIQYTTSFNLPPGKYRLKFVVRENQTGRMGSFEAEITLPEMKKAPLKMSSIVLASMRQPSKLDTPLVRNGEEYVPNISHVFRQDQHLYLLYEIYAPAREKEPEDAPRGSKPGIDLLSSLELIQGSTKVYETPMVQAKAINVEGRDAVAIELDVPLAGLKPGLYLCQLNVIDDAGGSFAFPRFAVLVKEPATAAANATAVQGAGGR